MKKGFTLIELLAVLLIISVVSLLIVPNVLKTSNKYKEKSIDYQKENILNAAGLYVNNYCLNNSDFERKSICLASRKHLIWYGDFEPYFDYLKYDYRFNFENPDSILTASETLILARIVLSESNDNMGEFYHKLRANRLAYTISDINLDGNVDTGDKSDAEELLNHCLNIDGTEYCQIGDNVSSNYINYDQIPGRVYFCLNALKDEKLIDDIKYEGEECKGLVEFTYYKQRYSRGEVILKCGNKYNNLDEPIYKTLSCFDR